MLGRVNCTDADRPVPAMLYEQHAGAHARRTCAGRRARRTAGRPAPCRWPATPPTALAGIWMAKPGIAGVVMSTGWLAVVWLKLAAVDQSIMGRISGRRDDVVGVGVKGVAQSWATGAVRSSRPCADPTDPPALIGPGLAGMPVSVKSPDELVTVEEPPIVTGMPASGLPFSSTTWPETSVEGRAGSVTVTGSTIVP